MDASQPALDLDIFRWGRIFGILSLDMARPHVPAMRLQLPEGDGFFVGLRDLIVAFRSKEQSNSPVEREFAPAAFTWIAGKFSAAFGDHLLAWGHGVFQYAAEDGKQAFLWSLMLRHRGDWHPAESEPEFVTAVREELRSRPYPSVYAIPPSSDWDRQYYARHGCDENCNPMHNVQSTISYCQFVESWHAALGKRGNPLTPEDHHAIFEWGLRRARAMQIPQERLEKGLAFPHLPAPWRPIEPVSQGQA
ncbi:MAG: hypothetical protein HYR84_16605 [Planctomycetes bacterium]|nr:hypothetical protein [Planctomycetota bacterium]